MTPQFPQTLWVVRHGQSAGNVARDAAEAQGLHVIDIPTRDIDVTLSDLGRQQSESLGRWFGDLAPAARPEVVLCSPYVRAAETARLLLSITTALNLGTLHLERGSGSAWLGPGVGVASRTRPAPLPR